MAQKTLFGGTVPKGKKKSPSKTGDSYINIVGTGKIAVRARSKKEAIRKARILFEDELRQCDLWDTKDEMMNRWKGLVGLEVAESSNKVVTENVKFDTLKWKNNPKQEWLDNRRLFGAGK